MNPSELFDDHQRHPRHLGKIADANVVGEVGSIVVGDALRLYLRVNDGIIEEAGFQVFSAQSMLGTSSVLCEMLAGKSIEEAQVLKPTDIAEYLGGVDILQFPAQLWGIEALKVALANALHESVQVDDQIDRLVCRCYGIGEERIREAINEEDCETVDAVAIETLAGTGCGSCRKDIQRIIDEVLRKPDTDNNTAKPRIAGRVATLMKITKHLHVAFPDAVEAGHFEPWDMQDNTVIIKFAAEVAADQRERYLKDLDMSLKDEVEATLNVTAFDG